MHPILYPILTYIGLAAFWMTYRLAVLEFERWCFNRQLRHERGTHIDYFTRYGYRLAERVGRAAKLHEQRRVWKQRRRIEWLAFQEEEAERRGD